jgi:DNA-binding transcriptional regulator YiaG
MTARAEFYIKGRPHLAEPYHLRGIGLPNIYLLNGVTIERDPEYGQLVTIDNVEGLHRAIGLHIVEKHGCMSGPELRFLRKQMNLSQAALGKRLRVTDQTVANYEKGKTDIPGPVDTLMRGLYLLHVLPPDTQARLMVDLIENERRVPDMSRRKVVGKWQDRGVAHAA